MKQSPSRANSSSASQTIHTYVHTYIQRIHKCVTERTGCGISHKHTQFHRIWTFISIFTRTHHLSLSWARSIQFIPLPMLFLENNIILPFMHRSSKWSLSFRLAHQNHTCTSPLLYTCHMPCASHFSWSGYPRFCMDLEQMAITSLYSMNWLVFITETENVYCMVQDRSLNTGYSRGNLPSLGEHEICGLLGIYAV